MQSILIKKKGIFLNTTLCQVLYYFTYKICKRLTSVTDQECLWQYMNASTHKFRELKCHSAPSSIPHAQVFFLADVL